MNVNRCPQCKKEINESTNRLIQDTCGHQKCRTCLLQEDFGCKICTEKATVETHINKSKCNISVIKYDRKSTDTSKCIVEETQKEENNIVHVSKTDTDVVENNESETSKDCEIYKNIGHIIILSKSPLLYKCIICSKTFSTTASVKYHSYCGGIEKPLKCEVCKKSFVSRSHLESHKLKHSGIRPFSCTHCQKSFLQKSKLNRHMKLHTGDRPFVCTECGKSFTNKDALTGHIRTHNGDKPFSCKFCGNRFNNKSNLSKHVATHSKEKPYMCEECGKKFGNKWTLASHRKCHNLERPFECQKCTKTFTNIKDLRRHSLIHLDVKPYGCNICNMKFCRKDNLERHLKNTHSIKDTNEIKSASIKTTINKKIIESTKTVKTVKEIEKVHAIPSSSVSEEIQEYKEKPNAIHVIKMNESQVPVPNPVDARPSILNAVPVINGPFKLAFKTDAFKNNYNILNRDYNTEPPPRIQTKKHDMVESLNICQKIFNPMSDSPAKYENPLESIKSSPVNTTKNVIMSVGKVNEKDSLEICKKIFAPNDSPPLHYETSFEHKKHAEIKNIKFKLPSTYTNNAIKINSEYDSQIENDLLEEGNIFSNIKTLKNYETENNNSTKNYAQLQPVKLNIDGIDSFSNNCTKSVIVNPLSSESAQKEPFSIKHWRKRTWQNLQPKINNNTL